MKQEVIDIQNLKCNGCVNSVKHLFAKFPEVKEVQVNLEEARVTLETEAEDQRGKYEDALSQAGYPPLGAANPLHRVAKSYVSCAIGRMSD